MSEKWGPLQGVKVVSCSTAQAGTVPYMLMADLGADVIKIETPDGGDGSRRMTVLPGMPSTFFETNNRGVKSVTLNLKSPEGRAILHKLVAKADIFGQNFRPSAADRNGFGWEELRKINPKLVYVSISGYGTRGPNGHLPGTDSMAQALGGIAEAYSMPGQKMRTGIASVADEFDRHAGLRRRARGTHPCAHHRRRPEDRAVAAGLAGPPDGLDLHHDDMARQESRDRPGAHHRHGTAAGHQRLLQRRRRQASGVPAHRTGELEGRHDGAGLLRSDQGGGLRESRRHHRQRRQARGAAGAARRSVRHRHARRLGGPAAQGRHRLGADQHDAGSVQRSRRDRQRLRHRRRLSEVRQEAEGARHAVAVLRDAGQARHRARNWASTTRRCWASWATARPISRT